MSSFVAGKLVLVVMAAIIGLLVLDVKEHGSFKASKTGSFLEGSGALHYGGIAWSNFRSYSQQGYRWAQENVPVYVAKTRESALPHLMTALDWLTYLAQQLWTNVKLVYKYFLDKKPMFDQWINEYAPGLTHTVSSWLAQALAFINDYTIVVVRLLLKYLSMAGDWLMENVFIDSLSPENLQRYTIDALNTTQKLASQTISWLNEKIVTVITAS